MPTVRAPWHTFAGGLTSPLALARVDLSRLRFAAETHTNYTPRTLGPMMLRPGSKYLATCKNSSVTRVLPFIYSNDDTALIELIGGSDDVMRVRVSDALVTRASVSTSITQGDFADILTNRKFDSDTAWTKGAGWAIAAGVASSDGSQSADSDLSQTVSEFTNGASYQVIFTVSGFSAGTITPVVGGTAGTGRTANGTYTETIVCGATTTFALRADADFIGSVDNVNLTGWTLADATIETGVLTLTADTLGTPATATRAVSVSVGDQNTEHAIRIEVNRGPVGFRIGTTSGGDEVMARQELGTGTHSLAFTPGATTIYLQYDSTELRNIIVAGGTIEASGTMEIAIPWTATGDLDDLSWVQSGDVIYIACDGYQQRKIERRSTTSWSLVKYEPEDGPFRPIPVLDCTLTPTATTGNITLAASQNLFKSTHVGSPFRLFNTAQERSSSLTLEDTYTSAIRITGTAVQGTESVGNRNYSVRISGTYTGILTLQRSFDGPDFGYTDVKSYTDGQEISETLFDAFINSIVYYRIGFKTQNPDPTGTADIVLSYPGGGGVGVVRITAVASATSASAEVLTELSSDNATRDWREGEWSDKYGYPTACTIFEGRLWWFGRDRIIASVSDAYESFDEDLEGDAGPINRTIGYGPIDRVVWALSLQRLLIGLAGSEGSIRSGSFGTPVTPTDFSIKDAGTQGSAAVQAVKVDSRGIFVQKSKRRVYQLAYSADADDYVASDLTVLLPDIDSNIVRLVVQRQPDTRVYAIRADGDVMVLLYEPAEEVVAWYRITTDGDIEDMAVLPGEVEDSVYWIVKRNINGSDVRYLEKVALESDCDGLPVSHCADSHVLYSGASTAARSGLTHLEGETVVIWAWDTGATSGKYLGTAVVSAGAVTQSVATTNACIGLSYTAQFKSAKLAYGAQAGTALTQKKRINYLGLILRNTHQSGIECGQDFTRMDPLPLIYRGVEQDTDKVYEEFDEPPQPMPGKWDSDSRLCLQTVAPKPCTVLGVVIGLSTHEK